MLAGSYNIITGSQGQQSCRNVILGGNRNTGSGNFSIIGNGDYNTICHGHYNTVLNGCHNCILSSAGVSHTSILGGCCNTVGSTSTNILHGGIMGGTCNKVQHDKAFIVGSNIITSRDCALHTNNLVVSSSVVVLRNLPTSDPGVPGQLYRSGADIKISL